jgi:hypothetical protein
LNKKTFQFNQHGIDFSFNLQGSVIAYILFTDYLTPLGMSDWKKFFGTLDSKQERSTCAIVHDSKQPYYQRFGTSEYTPKEVTIDEDGRHTFNVSEYLGAEEMEIHRRVRGDNFFLELQIYSFPEIDLEFYRLMDLPSKMRKRKISQGGKWSTHCAYVDKQWRMEDHLGPITQDSKLN